RGPACGPDEPRHRVRCQRRARAPGSGTCRQLQRVKTQIQKVLDGLVPIPRGERRSSAAPERSSMSGQSYAGQPADPTTATPIPTTTGPQPGISRRSVLRGAAGAGAARLAAAALAGPPGPAPPPAPAGPSPPPAAPAPD